MVWLAGAGGRMARPVTALAAAFAASLLAAAPARALETRSFVVSWFTVATFSEEGDCPKGLNPSIDGIYLGALRNMGYQGAELDRMFATALLPVVVRSMVSAGEIERAAARVDAAPPPLNERERLSIETARTVVEESLGKHAEAADRYASLAEEWRNHGFVLEEALARLGAARCAAAIGETERRRLKQIAHNEAHGITPRSIRKEVRDLIDGVYSEKASKEQEKQELQRAMVEDMSEKDVAKRIKQLEKQMLEHARNLEFEKAARLRDQLAMLKEQAFGAVVHDNVVPIAAAKKG